MLVGGITQTLQDEIATELEKKQQELNDRLKLLTSDNKDFQVTASYLLDLAQRAEQLFNESDEGLRQKLLEYVLSNIELKDKKLSYILNDPFRTVVETKKKSLSAHNSNIWCGYRDSNPGPLPWQGSALTTELHPHGGETRTRTEDTRLFRPLLYQLSYLAKFGRVSGVRTLPIKGTGK